MHKTSTRVTMLLVMGAFGLVGMVFASHLSNVFFGARAEENILGMFNAAQSGLGSVQHDAVLPPSGAFIKYIQPTEAVIAFTDNSNNEYGFTIDRFIGMGTGCHEPNTKDPAFSSISIPPNTLAAPRRVEYTITALTPETNYIFCIRAFGLEVESPYAEAVSVTTPKVGQIAPRIQDKIGIGVKDTTATIRWVTTTPASSVVDFSLQSSMKSYGSTTEFDAPPDNRVTVHTVRLENLVKGLKYYIVAYGYDAYGQKYQGAKTSFEVADIDLPALPVSATAKDNSVSNMSANAFKVPVLSVPNDVRIRYGLKEGVSDSDGDGYPDVLEILNNYDPISGSGARAYAFGLPRGSKSDEDAARKQLKAFFKNNVYATKFIEDYVKIMVYGGYSLADTVDMARKHITTNKPYGM